MFKDKIKKTLKEIEGDEQNYKTLRILQGIVTKNFEQLETLKDRRAWKQKMKSRNTVVDASPNYFDEPQSS